jgi:hypothetical protein
LVVVVVVVGSIKGLPIFFVSQIYTYTSPVVQFE